jgi:hypothetical protein
MISAETGHFKRIADKAAGFLGQGLNLIVCIIMGDQHGIFFRQVLLDFLFVRIFFPGG